MDDGMNISQRLSRCIAYGLYPLLWLWLLATTVWELSNDNESAEVAAVRAGVIATLLLACEWWFPLRRSFGMTLAHLLKRDVWMIAANGLFLAGLNTAVTILAVNVASSPGWLAASSLPVQVITGLLVFEALQYSLHRLMHTCPGAIGAFLWRCHAIHHLPEQLYFVMHGVFHPINGVLVRLFVQLLPVWLLGYSADAAFVITGVIGMHGMISHFNVDLRLGPMNYLFVGPELHRLHHAANEPRASNYAVALLIFDVAFRTFEYRPGQQPETLGLAESRGYPGQHHLFGMLLFPFMDRPGGRLDRRFSRSA
jgi:sterol desaturase/sphingolipid hydroxylase (fatty acid hydroxylase superfamily)